MWSSIAIGIKALDKLLGITEWFQRRAERAEHRRTGRLEQQNADLKAESDILKRQRDTHANAPNPDDADDVLNRL